ncbi:hypothetical protein LCGC14_0645580 [marine sediment metagenome]|uniref:Uncharacterized protein n=1 Tax=marine sediment metagenome TaxID=412755 RepID=A0A0F9U676_9ZZZZ|nr:MAG: hypothetical protein Lokiarch_43430 [Candidatus Lokiarchaeum sp. GC14_75]
MSAEDLYLPEEVLNKIREGSKGKIEMICLNCLIARCRFKEIEAFIQKNGIKIPSGKDPTKLEYLDLIGLFYYEEYVTNIDLQNSFISPLLYIATKLLSDENISKYLSRFDFISKQEIIDAFADYCADYGISVYDTSELKDFSIDLYLIKKKPLLRTEAVFVRTGVQMTEEGYKDVFNLINNASKIATWTVFVTTPTGVYNIGLDRLIADLEKSNTWFYVIDPLHQKIFGILKGKKSKNYDSALRDEYLKNLPHEPIRAPSRLVKISNYYFSESESYNPKSFVMYGFHPKEEVMKEEHTKSKKPKYKDIFRSLIIIDKTTGLPLISHTDEKFKIEQDLVSGFLTAMDSFVSEIGGTTSMKEISYKSFYIHAAYGKWVKLALFLSKPAKQSLKERLIYLLTEFESHYEEEIQYFQTTGNISIFDEKKITTTIKDILDI